MKIYAAGRNRFNELDAYIGKDLWVLAKLGTFYNPVQQYFGNYDFDTLVWVNILSKHEANNALLELWQTMREEPMTNLYIYKLILAYAYSNGRELLEPPLEVIAPEKDWIFENEYIVPIDQLKAVTPLQVYSTDEMFKILGVD